MKNQISSATITESTTFSADWWGWIYALLATLCFSIAPTLARGLISGGAEPDTLLAVRFVVSAFLTSLTIVLTQPSLFRVDRRGLLAIIAIAFFNAASMFCIFRAFETLPASIGSMLLSATPIVVLILLALRGEKITPRNIVRLLLGIGGVVLLVGGPSENIDPRGVVLVLVAVLGFGIQFAIAQWYMTTYDSRTTALYVTMFMAILIVGWWWLQGEELPVYSSNQWIAALLLAVVSTYLARLCLYAGINRIGSGQTSLFMPLETLLSVTWSFLFLDERLTLIQWLGGILILVSALLALKRRGRARRFG